MVHDFEKLKKLKSVVELLDKEMTTLQTDDVDLALAELMARNDIDYEDNTLMQGVLNLIHAKETIIDDGEVVRRLYFTLPYRLLIFLSLAMFMPMVVDIKTLVGSVIAALLPIIVVIVLHWYDLNHMGEEVCRVNKYGLYINPKYLDCSDEKRVYLDFIHWHEIESWTRLKIKGSVAWYPVMYLRYKPTGELVTINHMNINAERKIKRYNKNKVRAGSVM